MTIKELCDMLRAELYDTGYEYGFFLNGEKYRPNRNGDFDARYYHLATTVYCVQDLQVTRREKIGTCVEAALMMRQLLAECGVSSKIWLLYNREKHKVHTIATFEAEGKVVYLELTPQSSKTWYGKEIVYADEEEFLTEYRKNYDVSDVTDSIAIDQPPEVLLEKLR